MEAPPRFVNPYAGHRALTPTQAELLGEYARLAATIKRVSVHASHLLRRGTSCAGSGEWSALELGQTKDTWVGSTLRHRMPPSLPFATQSTDIRSTIQITSLSTVLSDANSHAAQLNSLRVLERKMGLVLTLFKASVWAIVVEQQENDAAAAAEAEAAAHGQGQGMDEGDETFRAEHLQAQGGGWQGQQYAEQGYENAYAHEQGAGYYQGGY